MARQLLSRLKITGDLIATTPIHVGGNGGDPIVDLALAVNGRGKFYVPGTSLAGALRAWMPLENEQFVNQVWGPLLDKKNRENSLSSSESHASFVVVEDAEISSSKIEIRDGVGIDRLTGTAAERVKFDRAILPKGTKIPLDITVEHSANQSSANWDQVKAEFHALLTALQNEEVYLGAAKTRGLGRVKLEGLKIKEQDLASTTGILATLKGDGKTKNLSELATASVSVTQRPRLSCTIHWQPVGPVMVKAEADGIAVDMLPLVSAVAEDNVSFVIPGSSIKGALRTQAERIIRTLLHRSIPDLEDPQQRFLQQLQDIPLIKSLFGNAARMESGQQLGQIAALSIADCYATKSLEIFEWAAIETAETEQQLRQRLDQANLRNTQMAMHVAIDRWTGGAADSFLYSTLEPMGVKWQPIELGLDLSRHSEEHEPMITLLLLLLRDLKAGRIPLGFGANRGLGAIEVTKVEISGRGLAEPLTSLTEATLEDGRIEELSGHLLRHLTNSWQAWLDEQMNLEAAS